MRPIAIACRDELTPNEPASALVKSVDLVVIRRGDDQPGGEEPVVMCGRCRHRGALLSDGRASDTEHRDDQFPDLLTRG